MTFNIDAVDVLVWGGGTGGVAAALQAARGGASTLLDPLAPGWVGWSVPLVCVVRMETNSRPGRRDSGVPSAGTGAP